MREKTRREEWKMTILSDERGENLKTSTRERNENHAERKEQTALLWDNESIWRNENETWEPARPVSWEKEHYCPELFVMLLFFIILYYIYYYCPLTVILLSLMFYIIMQRKWKRERKYLLHLVCYIYLYYLHHMRKMTEETWKKETMKENPDPRAERKRKREKKTREHICEKESRVHISMNYILFVHGCLLFASLWPYIRTENVRERERQKKMRWAWDEMQNEKVQVPGTREDWKRQERESPERMRENMRRETYETRWEKCEMNRERECRKDPAEPEKRYEWLKWMRKRKWNERERENEKMRKRVKMTLSFNAHAKRLFVMFMVSTHERRTIDERERKWQKTVMKENAGNERDETKRHHRENQNQYPCLPSIYIYLCLFKPYPIYENHIPLVHQRKNTRDETREKLSRRKERERENDERKEKWVHLREKFSTRKKLHERKRKQKSENKK